MNIVIGYKSDIAIYEQIFQQISSQIIKGELAANTCLPSIRTVAKELRVSVITIKKAWETLENQGFIYTCAGKGCFVADYTMVHLDNKKLDMAKERLIKDMPYYLSLGLTKEEIISLIEKMF